MPFTRSSSDPSVEANDISSLYLKRGGTKRSFLLVAARIFVVIGGASLLATTFVSESNMQRVTSSFIRRSQATVATQTSSSSSVVVVASTDTNADTALRSSWQATTKTSSRRPPKEDDAWPRIAWLMSFPNSGTSYTGQLVKHLSHTRTASNYGEQNLDQQGDSVPVYANQWDGPFYVDPASTSSYTYPTHYVLTKTHCGGFRQNAPPELYAETTSSFRRRCFGTKYVRHSKDALKKSITTDQAKLNHTATSQHQRALTTAAAQEGDTSVLRGAYDVSVVHRAIHLFRNPFDNVVSRFNFEQKRLTGPLAVGITKSRQGFRAFCRRMDEAWNDSERSSIVYDDSLLDAMQAFPCHSDFARYVEWHNQAFITTQDLGIDTMILHYEDYAVSTLSFNQTTSKILDFLELEPTGFVKPFVTGKVYSMEYFTREERAAVKKVLKMLALSVTWSNLEHYFS